MKVRELTVPGAWELTPTVHADSRGAFFEWFTDTSFTAMTGHSLDLRQANCSVSSAGVLRGVHFAQLPPSQAKYVTCLRGAVVDVVVDIRVGSPTFGRWDAVTLDDETHRAVYLSEGLGHGFVALQDNSVVTYLCSAGYDPGREHTIDPLDPTLAITWTDWFSAGELNLSDRDRAAPSLDAVRGQGLLPTWDEAVEFAQSLRT
ncbi:dTDP-4-keto-6-deoxy-D-glucose epimerase [Mycolicibacterium sp. 018/SC-01/001]|uniref:dTDP-4-dehydrorhamnose 3,5-epimerase family protein n=1 Tax=Mycolicibacterium sp. 018/SC-01/001 TaxID=2592069 RepID=UPI00117C1634|nr:dTDP-4-dehydrorhamnose 3,5-epimerase [Mycolicibacterium sp. 018/SC-01/001]TRW81704.1 dTDP-4-keto-6-deoxy-D-glucose epimerase [Mycolicibacterium sp. 018/SC-01/001]